MRDRADNVVVICSIENLDPMGVHTGDSVTVAPAMTLTDREYQRMRDLAIDIIRAVGVDTGGCNIQFAVDPATGRIIVIEMNPRVSRSSRAGLQGDRLPDRQDRRQARGRLHARRDPQRHHPGDPGQLRAVARLRRGEDPAVRLREVPRLRPRADDDDEERRRGDGARPRPSSRRCRRRCGRWSRPRARSGRRPTRTAPRRTRSSWPRTPHDGRLHAVERALRLGATPEQVHEATGIDPWFVDQLLLVVELRAALEAAPTLDEALLRRAKRLGTSDLQIARVTGRTEREVRALRARARRAPGLQDGRHLRRGVRRADAVPLLLLRRGDRGRAVRPRQGDHPGQRPEPDRAGHRVRLRLRARVVRAGRRRLRDDHGQLQPGDGQHRLRHQRPAVLRAAHGRGRARGRRRRAGLRRRRRRPAGRGRRAARRPDPAAAGPGAQGLRRADRRHHARRRSTWPRTAAPSARCSSPPGCPRRSSAPRRRTTEAKAIADGVGYPVLVRPVVRARRARHGDRLRRRDARRLRASARP